ETDASLDRLAGGTEEVASGITLVELAVKAWALSAKRQAAEAMQQAGAQTTSGVSLQAEFSLDLKPLLVAVVQQLDAIEKRALWIAAQMAGNTGTNSDAITVTRNTDFNLEDEASRIARIVGDFTRSIKLSPEAQAQIAIKWLKAAKIFDLDAAQDDSSAAPV